MSSPLSPHHVPKWSPCIYCPHHPQSLEIHYQPNTHQSTHAFNDPHTDKYVRVSPQMIYVETELNYFYMVPGASGLCL